MSKEDVIKMRGIVRDTFPSSKFQVELCDDEGNPIGHEVSATISGKLRMNCIKIIKGDQVEIEMSPYDLKTGRITWRVK